MRDMPGTCFNIKLVSEDARTRIWRVEHLDVNILEDMTAADSVFYVWKGEDRERAVGPYADLSLAVVELLKGR